MVNKLFNKISKITTSVTEFSVDGKLLSDAQSIANTFNKYFSETGHELVG